MSTMQSEDSQRVFELEERRETIVVKLIRRKIIEDCVIQLLGEQLFALAEDDRKTILIDFQAVEFSSATMIGKLILLDKRTKENGVGLVLRGIRGPKYMKSL